MIDYGLGLTDVCKAASGSDREVGTPNFEVAKFVALVEANQPRYVAFNGKPAAEVVLDRSLEYGRQLERVANADVFVLPCCRQHRRLRVATGVSAIGGSWRTMCE